MELKQYIYRTGKNGKVNRVGVMVAENVIDVAHGVTCVKGLIFAGVENGWRIFIGDFDAEKDNVVLIRRR